MFRGALKSFSLVIWLICSLRVVTYIRRVPELGLNSNWLLDTVPFYSLLFIILLLFSWVRSISISLDAVKSFGRFFVPVLSFLSFTVFSYFSTDSLIFLYIFFELSLIPITMIILGWGYQPERLRASVFLISYIVFASLPFLMVIVFKTAQIGSHSLLAILLLTGQRLLGVYHLWFLFFFIVGFLAKVPIYSLHIWLPKAHLEAPLAGSVILAAVILKIGVYGLWLVVPLMSERWSLRVFRGVPALAVWGGIISSIVCARLIDVKIIIAYSSVVHMAFVTARIFLTLKIGLTGAFLIAISHGFTSSGLFIIRNEMYISSNSRSILINKAFISQAPEFRFLVILLIFSNTRAPPFSSFISEVLIFLRIVPLIFVWGLLFAVTCFFRTVYNFIFLSSTQMNIRRNSYNKVSDLRLIIITINRVTTLGLAISVYLVS